MRKTNLKIINESREFRVEEMFFSRTDLTGKILSGNSVFQKISGYSWEDLMHKPHNVIRHPDMPRCVFQLFWNHLLQNKPVAAYVKNLAADGRYYWVFALALPCENGFVSIRIKPTSNRLQIVENLYNQILGVEQKTNIDEASAKLLQELHKIGFENYQDFMTDSLLLEIMTRNKSLANNVSLECLHDITKLHTIGKELTSSAVSALKIHQTNRFQALNLEITSANSELTANSMGKIAHYFQGISQGIKSDVNKLNGIIKTVNDRLSESQFLIAATDLIGEMVLSFKHEAETSSVHFKQEQATLTNLASKYYQEVYNNSLDLNVVLRNLKLTSEELANSIGGLEFVRITGKIEASTLNEELVFRSSIHEMAKVVNELKKIIINIRDKQEIMFKHSNEITRKIRDKSLEFQYAG